MKTNRFLRRLRLILVFIIGFSIPFNQVTVSLAGRSWTISLFCILFYFISMSSSFGEMGRLSNIYGKKIYLPMLFFFLLTGMNIINYQSNEMNGPPILNMSIFWCIVLYYVLLIHQYVDKNPLDYCLIGIAIGCIIVAVCFVLGYQVDIRNGRKVIFNENANAIGIFQGIGAIVILNKFIIKDFFHLKFFKWLWILVFVPIMMLVMASGSRTAFVIIVMALVGTILLYPTTKTYLKILVLLIGFIGLYFLAENFINTDSVLLERLMTTVDDGDSSGRDELFNRLMPAIFENPILGVGDTGYVSVSRQYLGIVHIGENVIYGASPHNVFMEVFLLTGICGFVIMVTFWLWEFKNGWYKYKKESEPIFALLIFPVLACLLSSQLLAIKWAYIIYAIVLTPKCLKSKISRK